MPVSSTTHADSSSSGTSRSAQARTNTAGSHGESAKNCCNDSYRAASSPSRNSVGCRLLRPPCSINPRTYTSAFSRRRTCARPAAISATNSTSRSRASTAGFSDSIATATCILTSRKR